MDWAVITNSDDGLRVMPIGDFPTAEKYAKAVVLETGQSAGRLEEWAPRLTTGGQRSHGHEA